MRKKQKILLLFRSPLTHNTIGTDYEPLFREDGWEYIAKIRRALKRLGHHVILLGVRSNVRSVLDAVEDERPDIAFNLVTSVHGRSVFETHFAAFLELNGIRYTGTGPYGMTVCRDKALCKKVLLYHNIPTPAFEVYLYGKRIRPPRHLTYPLFVKPLDFQASVGVSEKAFVSNDRELVDQVEWLHSQKKNVLVEEYIDGLESCVSILGNKKLTAFPVRELWFGGRRAPIHFQSYQAKWDEDYKREYVICDYPHEHFNDSQLAMSQKMCKKVYQILQVNVYGRVDLRWNKKKEPYVIDVNPNCSLVANHEYALSARKAGLSYEALMQRIIDLSLQRFQYCS